MHDLILTGQMAVDSLPPFSEACGHRGQAVGHLLDLRSGGPLILNNERAVWEEGFSGSHLGKRVASLGAQPMAQAQTTTAPRGEMQLIHGHIF